MVDLEAELESTRKTLSEARRELAESRRNEKVGLSFGVVIVAALLCGAFLRAFTLLEGRKYRNTIATIPVMTTECRSYRGCANRYFCNMRRSVNSYSSVGVSAVLFLLDLLARPVACTFQHF